MDKDLKDTITVTFSETIENHVGMEKLGISQTHGIPIEKLEELAHIFSDRSELINLRSYMSENDDKSSTKNNAAILIIRNGVQDLLENEDDSYKLFENLRNLDMDKKAYMRGRVVNKHARWNLLFADFEQEPDYENKKGRVINFVNVPLLNIIRDKLSKYLEDVVPQLLAELNYYYDITKTGIGFHGDTERRIVVGMRLGASIPLHYQWFQNGKPIGERCVVKLNHGDIYIMSDKAVGYDWKKRIIPTLRHATGSKKYTVIG